MARKRMSWRRSGGIAAALAAGALGAFALASRSRNARSGRSGEDAHRADGSPDPGFAARIADEGTIPDVSMEQLRTQN